MSATKELIDAVKPVVVERPRFVLPLDNGTGVIKVRGIAGRSDRPEGVRVIEEVMEGYNETFGIKYFKDLDKSKTKPYIPKEARTGNHWDRIRLAEYIADCLMVKEDYTDTLFIDTTVAARTELSTKRAEKEIKRMEDFGTMLSVVAWEHTGELDLHDRAERLKQYCAERTDSMGNKIPIIPLELIDLGFSEDDGSTIPIALIN